MSSTITLWASFCLSVLRHGSVPSTPPASMSTCPGGEKPEVSPDLDLGWDGHRMTVILAWVWSRVARMKNETVPKQGGEREVSRPSSRARTEPCNPIYPEAELVQVHGPQLDPSKSLANSMASLRSFQPPKAATSWRQRQLWLSHPTAIGVAASSSPSDSTPLRHLRIAIL